MQKNHRSAAPPTTFRGDPLAAFDRLPARLRQALHEAVIQWDPREVRWTLNQRLRAGVSEHDAIAAEIWDIRLHEENEVRAFSYHWPSRFGRYPHTAAGATILRYDERDRRRSQRSATP
jgi:hypothetical protein